MLYKIISACLLVHRKCSRTLVIVTHERIEYQMSWARDNTVATTRSCFQATKLFVIEILPYLMWLLHLCRQKDVFFLVPEALYVVALSRSYKIVACPALRNNTHGWAITATQSIGYCISSQHQQFKQQYSPEMEDLKKYKTISSIRATSHLINCNTFMCMPIDSYLIKNWFKTFVNIVKINEKEDLNRKQFYYF